jgi:hypothetical protein
VLEKAAALGSKNMTFGCRDANRRGTHSSATIGRDEAATVKLRVLRARLETTTT